MLLKKFVILKIVLLISIVAQVYSGLCRMEETVHAAQEITAQEWSEPARLITRSLLLDIAVSPNRMIAVGDQGYVVQSTDQGKNWTQVFVPTQSMLNAVRIASNRHTWIVGHNSTILHSADKGETWIRQYFNPENDTPLFDVWFNGINRGMAVGAHGFAIETHDGGKHWTPFTIVNRDPHFYGIIESLQQTLYVFGEFGSLFRSQDMGKTWQVLPIPYQGPLFGMLVHSKGPLLIFGFRGTIFRSENGGEDWQRIPSQTTTSLLSSVELKDGSIIILGATGIILHSQDEGRSFFRQSPPAKNDAVAIAATHQGALLTVGGSGIRNIHNPLSAALPKQEH